MALVSPKPTGSSWLRTLSTACSDVRRADQRTAHDPVERDRHDDRLHPAHRGRLGSSCADGRGNGQAKAGCLPEGGTSTPPPDAVSRGDWPSSTSWSSTFRRFLRANSQSQDRLRTAAPN